MLWTFLIWWISRGLKESMKVNTEMKNACATILTWMLMTVPGLCVATESRTTESLLPVEITQPAAKRTSDVSLFVGDKLFEHINGGAGLYLNYDFKEVATADYLIDGIDMTIDIYRFSSSMNAYGLYSMERPSEPEHVSIGVEGFSTGCGIVFVKGEYMVKLISYSPVEEAASRLLALSKSIEIALPGTLSLPELFSHFPLETRIEKTGRIHASGYLGRQGLEYAFSMQCVAGKDTLTLFLAEDRDGSKFHRLAGSAQNVDHSKIEDGLPFKKEKTLRIEDSYYGCILIGVRNDFIAGIVGYDSRFEDFLRKWVLSLQKSGS